MIKQIIKLITLPYLRVKCKHEYKINGWTSVKCKICDEVSYDMALYNKVYDEGLEAKYKSMKKAGFKDVEIFTELAKVTPI